MDTLNDINLKETKEEQREKENYITWINVCIGLTDKEIEDYLHTDIRKVRFKYKMVLTEKTDEMLNQ